MEREEEQAFSYDTPLARLRADLRSAVSCKTTSEALVARWRHLPRVDPLTFRADVDSITESAL